MTGRMRLIPNRRSVQLRLVTKLFQLYWQQSSESSPFHVASAASFKHDHTSAEPSKVLSNKIHARVSLQGEGSDAQQAVPFTLQQLMQLLF